MHRHLIQKKKKKNDDNSIFIRFFTANIGGCDDRHFRRSNLHIKKIGTYKVLYRYL